MAAHEVVWLTSSKASSVVTLVWSVALSYTNLLPQYSSIFRPRVKETMHREALVGTWTAPMVLVLQPTHFYMVVVTSDNSGAILHAIYSALPELSQTDSSDTLSSFCMEHS